MSTEAEAYLLFFLPCVQLLHDIGERGGRLLSSKAELNAATWVVDSASRNLPLRRREAACLTLALKSVSRDPQLQSPRL